LWHPKKLGQGSFSDVFLVTRKRDKVQFAMKRNRCAESSWDSLFQEYWLLHFASHPNVVAIEEVFLLFADPLFLSSKEYVEQQSSDQFVNNVEFRDDLTRQTTQDDKFGPWLDDIPSERCLSDPSSASALLKGSSITSSFLHRKEQRCCYIIMEYIAGGDLFSFLARRKQSRQNSSSSSGNGVLMSEVEALHIAVQIFDALRYLHDPSRRGALFHLAAGHQHQSSGNFSRILPGRGTGPIVHGDIKPRNILLDMTGLRFKKASAALGEFQTVRAVLTDFGGAGTERYVAPEAIGKLIAASDVFSAGCVTFELLCGSSAASIRSFHFACKQEKFAVKARDALLSVGASSETATYVTNRLMAYDHHLRPTAEEAYRTLLGFYKAQL
jgi:serine/threonine protein kinase